MLRKIFINPEYLRKARQFRKNKDSFYQWKSKMESMVNPSLQELLDLKDSYQISVPRMVMPDVDFSLTVYRVRIIASGSGEDISNPDTFSYPPAVYATGFQRANAPGYPVFYAAADGKSALEEVRLNGEPLKVGDQVFLTKWRVRDGIKYSLNHLTKKNIVAEHHGFKDLTLKVYSEMDRIFKNEDVFLDKEQRFLFEESTELFFSKSYHASGTIGHDILYRTPVTNGIKISGIIYPSCANEFRGVNFAFHPDFVDNALELVSVELATFKEFSEDGANLTSRYKGSVVDGKIVWTVQRLYLQIHELTSQVFLEEDCDQEDVYEAIICLVDGSKMKLHDYCLGQADLIDLSQHEMMSKQEELARIGKRFGYKLHNTFVNGTVKLQVKERLINVDNIVIVVPIDPKFEEISADEVFAKL